MTFTYTFEKQTGPDHYSEQTDEIFCDTVSEEYDYDIYSNEIIKGLLAYYEVESASLEEQVKAILSKSEIDFTQQEIDAIIAQSKSSSVADIITSRVYIEDYLNDDEKDFLKDYFEEEAYDEFICS